MRLFPVVLLTLTFLAGCGYKGPLYIEKPKPEARKPATIVVPEPAPERPVPADAVPTPK